MVGLKNGWIKLERAIQYHWLWNDKPFDKARAWIDLLLMANYEERKFFARNTVQNVRAGEIITSISQLAERWGWNRKTVKGYLKVLEADNMIHIKSTRHWTTISLVNYEKYQGGGSTERTTKGATKSQQNGQQNTQQRDNRLPTMEERTKKELRNIKKGATTLPSEGKGLPTQPEVEEEDEEYSMMTEWKDDDE